MHGLEGRFEEVARQRPFDLVAPTAQTVRVDAADTAVPQPAAYVTLTGNLPDPAASASLTLTSGAARLSASYDTSSARISLEVADATRTTTHRSRRFGRCPTPPRRLALTLTGLHLTAFAHDGERWTARGRVDLRDRLDPRAEDFVAGLRAVAHGTSSAECGGFGQLGLRDLRFVTTAEGEPVREGDGAWLLTATNAGPGFFDAAHTGVWSLDPGPRGRSAPRRPVLPPTGAAAASTATTPPTWSATARRWLVATSTWGDLDVTTPQRRRRATVGSRWRTGRRPDAGPARARHPGVAAPTDGLGSVATWDPHLVRERRAAGWSASSARRSCSASTPPSRLDPTLDDLALRRRRPTRRATEGTTLLRDGAGLAGRRQRRPRRPARPAPGVPGLRPAPAQLGQLDAAYLTNLPWPALAPDPDRPGGWLMVAFNGRAAGGEVLGYGTHGDVVVLRS